MQTIIYGISNMSSLNTILTALVIFGVLVLFFYAIRELIIWYWKIDINTESLSRIADSLEIIASSSNPSAISNDRDKEKEEIPGDFKQTDI